MLGVSKKLIVTIFIVLVAIGTFSHVAFGRSKESTDNELQNTFEETPLEFARDPEPTDQSKEILELQNKTLLEAVLQLRRELANLKANGEDLSAPKDMAALEPSELEPIEPSQNETMQALVEELEQLKAERDRFEYELALIKSNEANQPVVELQATPEETEDANPEPTEAQVLEHKLRGYETLEKEHKELMTELSLTADAKEQLEVKLTSLEAELEKTKLEAMQAKLSASTPPVENSSGAATSEALLALSAEFKTQEQKLLAIENEKKTLELAVSQHDAEKKALEQKISQFEQERVQLQKERKDAAEAISTSLVEFERLRKELSDVKSKYDAQQSVVLQTKAAESEIATLKSEKNRLSAELLEKNAALEQAKVALTDAKTSEASLEQLFTKYKQLEKEHAESASKQETLQAEYQRVLAEREALKSSTQAQFDATESLTKALEVAKISATQKNEEVQKVMAALGKYKSEYAKVAEEANRLAKENERLQIMYAEEQKRADEASGKTEAVARRAAEKIADLGKVENQIQSCQSELSQYKALAEQAGTYKRELVELKNELLLKDTEMNSIGGDNSGRGLIDVNQAAQVEQQQAAVHEAPVTQSDVLIVEVTTPKANLRSGPGYEHSPVMQVARGTRLTVEARQGEWFRVISPTGSRAYIQAEVVSDGKGNQRAQQAQSRQPQVRREEPTSLYEEEIAPKRQTQPRVQRERTVNTEDILEQRARKALTPIGGARNAPSKRVQRSGNAGLTDLDDEAFEDLRRELLSGSEGS